MQNLIFALFLISPIVSANIDSNKNQNRTLREIQLISQDISDATRTTQASGQDLTDTLELLEEALTILEGRNNGGGVFVECRQFAFPILDRVLSSADALDEAVLRCRTVSDMSVMRFAHSKLSRIMSTQRAVEMAANAADIRMKDKAQLLDFAFSKYNRILSTDRAIQRSLMNLRPVVITRSSRSRIYNCFQSTFPQFDRTLSTDQAMDRTVAACTTR